MGQAPTWNLNLIFDGGAAGDAYTAEVAAVRRDAEAWATIAAAIGPLEGNEGRFTEVFAEAASLQIRAQNTSSFAHCCAAEDTGSEAARLAVSTSSELYSTVERGWVPLKARLAEADDAVFDAYCATEAAAPYAASLRHSRDRAKLELDPALEELAVTLEREALHGWGQLYSHVSGTTTTELTLPGEAPQTVSVGVLNTYKGHGDEAVRRVAHETSERAWQGNADVCAMALTHLTGARQTRCDRAGIAETAHSYHDNRVTPALVEAMWAAADHARPKLVAYLDRKAQLIGKTKLDWWDQQAPLGGGDASISWEQAQRSITDAFAGFSPELQNLAERAFTGGWIEAEKRAGKSPGGFCAGFDKVKQSRIFMTWGRTLRSSLTLAHELGHAFHNEVIFTEHPFRRQLTSCLAETASTFCEAVYRDHALGRATDDAVRIRMLDQQLQAGVVFLMNIRARYLFERDMYDLRRTGPLTPDALSALVVAAEQRAYGDALASWDPMLWANKLHFYISHFGFYNWPYAFGYLFSGAVYQRFVDEGPSFTPQYLELLRRTGWDDCVSIGRECLGADMEQPEFWINATKPLLADIDRFLELT